MIMDDTVLNTIKDTYEHMFLAEKKVADYILENPEKAVETNVSELAKLSDVSDATVVRMCKHAGYQGYYQMKIKLSHDLGSENGSRLSSPVIDKNNIVQGLFEVFKSNLEDVAANLDMELMMACAQVITEAKYVHIIGAGNTTPVVSDLGFRLGRFGIRTTHNVVPEYFLNHISLAQDGDVVIAISNSGTSKQVLQALNLIRGKNIKTILITATNYSPMTKVSDYVLLSKSNHVIFHNIGPASHLNELVISDTLLYFVVNYEKISQKIESSDSGECYDDLELLLAEYKL